MKCKTTQSTASINGANEVSDCRINVRARRSTRVNICSASTPHSTPRQDQYYHPPPHSSTTTNTLTVPLVFASITWSMGYIIFRYASTLTEFSLQIFILRLRQLLKVRPSQHPPFNSQHHAILNNRTQIGASLYPPPLHMNVHVLHQIFQPR